MIFAAITVSVKAAVIFAFVWGCVCFAAGLLCASVRNAPTVGQYYEDDISRE